MSETLPAEIPPDIDQVATRIAGEYLAAPISCAKLYREVAEALLAERLSATESERERCADIAEHLNGWGARDGTAEHIAKVIRSQP